MMIVEQLVECELAGEIEVLGEKLAELPFRLPQIPHDLTSLLHCVFEMMLPTFQRYMLPPSSGSKCKMVSGDRVGIGAMPVR
jgi:hypothetical protein